MVTKESNKFMGHGRVGSYPMRVDIIYVITYTLPAKNMEYFSLQSLQTHKPSKNRINRYFDKLIHGIQHFMRLESALLIIHDGYQGSRNPGENYIISIHANMLLKT